MRAPSRPPCHQLLSEHHLKQRVLNVFIPSSAWDTACTSNAGKLGVKFIPTALKSTRVFALANGHPTPATNISLLKHKHLREAERTLHIVVALAHQSLLSGGQFANAGYISICYGAEGNIYDGRTSRITVSKAVVLKVWHCPKTKLWKIPLQYQVTNINTDNLLLDGPMQRESLNAMYVLPSATGILQNIAAFTSADRPPPSDAINNVYELPIIERAVRYLHGAAGFPTKETCLRAICKGH